MPLDELSCALFSTFSRDTIYYNDVLCHVQLPSPSILRPPQAIKFTNVQYASLVWPHFLFCKQPVILFELSTLSSHQIY